ncbi:MAG: O-methyltransferase [Stackebrandtia sp.]
MGRNVVPLSPEILNYVVDHGIPPDALMRELAAETHSALPQAAGMQIGPDQTAFMELLTRIVGVDAAVEVGTFTGMSSLAIARGMRPGGRLTCFDVSEEYTAIAKRYWERAGLADRIELRIGDAREGVKRLPSEPHLDLVFLDADKPGYETYWAELVPRVRAGGVLLADNTLWSGRVIETEPDEESTRVIKRFNDLVSADDRVDVVMLAIGDGLTVARKR